MERELRWKMLSSKYVFQDRWFQARADRCEFPDGRIIEPYYVVEVPDWCNTIILTKDERVILVRQYRYAADQITFELPGGLIEKGEDPMNAAKREMEEETGFTSDEFELISKVSPNPSINNNTAYFYLARNAYPIANIKNMDEFEDIDVVSFSKEELWQLLKENKIQHGVQVGPLYAAFVKLGWLQYS